jgi:hypothetical protein
MTSITQVFPLEITLNILSFADSQTLTSLSYTNKVFYFLTCRDELADSILWRNIFLSELFKLKKQGTNIFRNTINKYLNVQKEPKMKSVFRFTDDDGNTIQLSDIYLQRTDLVDNIQVTGCGTNNCHILQWKSVWMGHCKACIIFQYTGMIKQTHTVEEFFNNDRVLKILHMYPTELVPVTHKAFALNLALTKSNSLHEFNLAKKYLNSYGLPINFAKDVFDKFYRSESLETSLWNYIFSEFKQQCRKTLLVNFGIDDGYIFLQSLISCDPVITKSVIKEYVEMFRDEILAEDNSIDFETATQLAQKRTVSLKARIRYDNIEMGPVLYMLETWHSTNLIVKLDLLYEMGADINEQVRIYITVKAPIYTCLNKMECVEWFLAHGSNPLDVPHRNLIAERFNYDIDYDWIYTIERIVPDLFPSIVCSHSYDNRNILHFIASSNRILENNILHTLLQHVPSSYLVEKTRIDNRTPVELLIMSIENRINNQEEVEINDLQLILYYMEHFPNQPLFLESDVQLFETKLLLPIFAELFERMSQHQHHDE